jgi:cytochrome c oxidase subunit IV
MLQHAETSPWSGHMTKKSTKKERGLWLSIWLILIILMNLLTLVLIVDRIQQPETMSFPYLITALFVFSAGKVVAAIGIWVWERWALYVYAGAVVGTIVIGLMLTGTWLFAFNEALPMAILGWMLKDRYDYFT